jgi:uncharacterized protein YbaR (Trm112 family)
MFIELLDSLRCPEDHPQIPLVAAITARDDRMVTEGVLGCPTCRREYSVHRGIVFFTAGEGVPQREGNAGYRGDGALRAGAFLRAAEGVTVALVGQWAMYAHELSQLVPLRAYAVNADQPVGESERVGDLLTDRRLPFTMGSLSGVAIDERGWTREDLAGASRALAPSGRMVARADAPVPGEIEEIARDSEFWVGEKRGPLVALHRR